MYKLQDVFTIKIISKIKLDIKYPLKIINRIVLNLPCSWHIKGKIFCNYYTKYIFSKLVKMFNEANKISKEKKKDKEYSNRNSKIIWVFWWQGYKQMPLIVKKCFQSIKKHANGHRVILVTNKNIYKYATIPKYIYYRLYNKDITLTHFSDVLRFNLLNNYGGLWIDSTMYCSSNLTDEYFTKFYTCGDYNIEQSHNFACRWTEFLIGGTSHSDIFEFMNTFFNLYWKYHRCSIDYFEADYVLRYAYLLNMSNFRNYVDKIAPRNNPHLYYLLDYLNKSYNYTKYKSITKDTSIFKLTYKMKFRKTNVNKETFYNRLIHE